ncbi:hypothetical protein ACQP2P_27370 [Dactylosporangium sp. CA-139114]|uniref:hypothetical protein n=1 Tax=Dactylosporangium sp. CA-139114 TaxID=3239931 RepID=UPI003D976979
MTNQPQQRPPEALPPEVHERTYVNRVRRENLDVTSTGAVREPVPPSEQIQVIVLSGRPAVGKSSVIARLTRSLPREPVIAVPRTLRAWL